MQSRARDGTDVKEGEASREQCPAIVWCHSDSPTIYHSYAGVGAGMLGLCVGVQLGHSVDSSAVGCSFQM